jgi:hypothetical protein
LGRVLKDSFSFFFLNDPVDFVQTSDKGCSICLSQGLVESYSSYTVDVDRWEASCLLVFDLLFWRLYSGRLVL